MRVQSMPNKTIQKILVVDDDPLIVQALKDLLENNSVKVFISQRAEDVEILMKEYQFSLFLVDLRLSGVDGIEGLEIVRYCKEKQPESHVILMTGYGSDEIRDTAYRYGATKYLEKPLDIGTLVAFIQDLGIPVGRKPQAPLKSKANSRIGKILIVEDSELLQRMYTMVFRRYTEQGCNLIQARNGKEGLEKLSQEPDVSLIVLDINMPIMNGLEFLQSAARRKEFSHIPVVVVSTEGHEEDTQRALNEGATNYVTKPFKPQELLEIVDKAMTSA